MTLHEVSYQDGCCVLLIANCELKYVGVGDPDNPTDRRSESFRRDAESSSPTKRKTLGRMISAPTPKIFIISPTLSHFLRKFSPQKHSRTARLERFALLLVSSPQHLASSAAGGTSVLRPLKGRLLARMIILLHLNFIPQLSLICFITFETCIALSFITL